MMVAELADRGGEGNQRWGEQQMMTPLTSAERRKLENQLREQLRQDCQTSRSIGYPPNKFLIMLSKDGPVEACRQVILPTKIPDGFMTLLELKRLDLTAEATILRGPWRRLFDETVIEAAKTRLIKFERPDLAISL